MFPRFKPNENSLLGMISEVGKDARGCTVKGYREYKERKERKEHDRGD
jgi:hypothetical protein